jgi:hypothetical protein
MGHSFYFTPLRFIVKLITKVTTGTSLHMFHNKSNNASFHYEEYSTLNKKLHGYPFYPHMVLATHSQKNKIKKFQNQNFLIHHMHYTP